MAISSASAPQLKPLLKSMLGGSTFQKSEDYHARSGSNSNSRSRSQSDARHRMTMHRLYGSRSRGNDIEMGNYKGHVTSDGRGSANTSQENIMGNGIMKTTDVKVDIEMGRGKNDSEDSLRRLEFGL
jgi:hypothetical protein